MGADFVRAGKRRVESQAGLRHLGVPLSRQLYLELPDGGLADHGDETVKLLTELVEGRGIDRIFTTGPDGYDGHPDHIALHNAAVTAATGRCALWGLHASHRGEWVVGGSVEQKLGAISMHGSQQQSPDIARWGNTDLYTPLIVRGETYARIVS